MRAVGENKKCSKCCEWKHVGEFGRDKSAADGCKVQCRACVNECFRAARANPERLQRLRENAKKYRAKNPDAKRARDLRKLAKYNWMKEKLLELGVQV